ncbi:MAG TPA: hypothetical protein VGY58_10240 [Gemmataceae bacterium]|nr:hypothetical protein [Gemmataceae bacterium]
MATANDTVILTRKPPERPGRKHLLWLSVWMISSAASAAEKPAPLPEAVEPRLLVLVVAGYLLVPVEQPPAMTLLC